MNCQRLKEIEEKNLYNKITADERAEVLLHIEECEECKKNYESSFMCQEEFDKIEIPEKEFYDIKEKVHSIVDKLADHSLFDFIFGFGHSPYKAGIIVGVVFLLIILVCINVCFNHKPSKYEHFRESSVNVNYINQFQNK